MRRDILALKMGAPKREKLVEDWIKRVDNIFRLNKLRLDANTDLEFEVRDQALKNAMTEFKRRVFALAKDTRIHEDLKKVFGSITKDWRGYYLFVDHPANHNC